MFRRLIVAGEGLATNVAAAASNVSVTPQLPKRIARSLKTTIRHQAKPWLRYALAALTGAAGLLDIYSVTHAVPHGFRALRELIPGAVVHASRTATLLAGFILVLSSIHLARRKRRAYRLSFALCLVLAVFQILRGSHFASAAVSLGIAVLLWLKRREFTVRSYTPDPTSALSIAMLALFTAITYGVAGFWFLEVRHFGMNFDIRDSVKSTLQVIAFVTPRTLVPLTQYGAWFLRSMHWLSMIFIGCSAYSLFRPVLYKYQTRPRDLSHAESITRRFGRTAQDFYKFWPDKSLFFSGTGKSFVAYRVALNTAVVLGDPVGPSEETTALIEQFAKFCRNNDWRVAFHQATADLLPAYRGHRLREIKIGDDAIVDLTTFNLDQPRFKTIRNRLRQLDRSGFQAVYFEPPIPQEVLADATRVSNEWLLFSGRRERAFSLGHFDLKYLSSTPLVAVYSGSEMHAFLNVTPSFHTNEAAVDLMRRSAESPNGVMDFLFVRTFDHLRQRGFARFNFGMAPLTGFPGETPTLEERAVHAFLKRLKFFFNFEGIRHYKAKYASWWEARYEVFQSPLDLPVIALALAKVSRFQGQPAWSQNSHS